MNTVCKKIRLSGGRLTRVKKAILEVLAESSCLLSRTDLAEKLKVKKVEPDRSTIYRELKFLTKNSVIITNNIAGVDYYEMPKDHHHHLVCLDCNAITRVEIGNHLKKQEQRIAAKDGFEIISHSLEFYGYCRGCRGSN